MAERTRRTGPIEYLVGSNRYFEVQQRAGAAMVSLLVFGVLATIALARPGEIEQPGALAAMALGGLMFALATVGLARRSLVWFDVLAVSAPAVVTAGLYFLGPTHSESAVIVSTLCMCVTVFIRPGISVAAVGTMLTGYVLLVSFDDGYSSPAARSVLVVTVTVTGAGLLLWLFRHLERLALSEREATAKVAAANRTLQQFLSPQIAATVLDGDDPALLEPHRRQIAVVFVDLRGSTAFTAGAEPEEVVDVLGELYAAFGEEVERHDATFGSYAGDGVMAFVGDPVPVEDPVDRALELAEAVRGRVIELQQRWSARGHRLGHGIGVAYGYATLGVVGHHRREYTPLGSVVNLAARLSDEASDGEILVDQRAHAEIDRPSSRRDLRLKGFNDPVAVYALH